MTLTTVYRNEIDALRLDFHSGGITNPITVIEQISYLMFARLLDITESREEKRGARLKKDFKRIFPADKQHLRWSHSRNHGGDRMLAIVRDEFFPFMRTNLQQHPLGRSLRTPTASSHPATCFPAPSPPSRNSRSPKAMPRATSTSTC
jgi:type I restriction enzyme M protein